MFYGFDFTETLHSWQNFYFMVGGASAGWIGLMLVALSLGQVRRFDFQRNIPNPRIII